MIEPDDAQRSMMSNTIINVEKLALQIFQITTTMQS
jgi:hypothetical protein